MSWPFRKKPSPIVLRCTIDFTRPTKDHWARYENGGNFDALFSIRGYVAKNDDILVPMQSGRIGRYRLFSVIRDFMGAADWKARGVACGYQEPIPTVRPDTEPRPVVIKGLLGDGTRWVRSDKGELAHLPSGFTKPSSEFWKILTRHEARRGWADRVCATYRC